MRLRAGWVIGIWVVCALLAHAGGLSPAITGAELDLANCTAFEGARAIGSPPRDVLEALLGLRPVDRAAVWSTGRVPGLDRHFRVAFTHPVTLGTICTTYTGGRSAETLFQLGAGTSVAYLKPEAAAPGDVDNAEQWVVLPPGAVKTLPAGVATRALRFSERRVQYPWANLEWGMEASDMGMALLLNERCYNALPYGDAKALGKNGSDGWLGYWADAQPIAGLALLSPRTADLRLERLKAGIAEHPTLAPATAWERVADIKSTGTGPSLWTSDAPLTARALRLSPRAPGAFPQVLPLFRLTGSADPPSLAVAPPFTVPYTMPRDGFIAINIADKATGKHVRRLIAETARLHGPVNEAWDLKDDNGRYVPPGDYTWTGIARPQLHLTYEGTVNNSGNPPWYAPVTGGGGWMSDHCTPVSVRACGDHLFMGTYGAEYGQSLIATDLDGHKVWAGQHGADRLVADDHDLYTVSPAGVTRIDAKTFAARRMINLSYSRDVPGVVNGYGNFDADSGAAALSGDRLFISYNSPGQPWVESSFPDDQVDFDHCVPRPHPRPRVFDARFYDEHMLFAGTFLTGSAPSADVVRFGPAPTSGPLTGTLTVVFTKPTPVGSILLPDGAMKVYALKPTVKPADVVADPSEAGPGDEGAPATDPLDDAQWIPLESPNKPGQPVLATATPGVLTRALRFKAGELRFCLVLNRRYQNIAPDAERVCSDGSFDKKQSWLVSRPPTKPINAQSGPRMALVWKQAVALRGVTLIAPTHFGAMAVDYWTGPADGTPAQALDDDSQWQYAGTVTARDSTQNNPVSPLAANVDFGDVRQTRAVRVRALSPAGSLAFGRPIITGAQQASLGGIIAYSPTPGQDAPLPPALNERITEIKLPPAGDNTAPATLVRHLPVPHPTFMIADHAGTLYVVADRRVIAYPEGKLDAAPRIVVPADQLAHPRALALDADGLLYVIDAGPCVVKVFNPATGALVRTIGTPGGFNTGPYDPTRFDNPVDLTIDSAGKLWVTDEFNMPKRITRWSRDGKLEQTFMGPTYYGGGGHIDPGDHHVVRYLGMKFVMNDAHQWHLESRIGRQPDMPFADRAVYLKGKQYLVSDLPVSLFADPGGLVGIFTERNGAAVPLVVAGNLAKWDAARHSPELRKAFAGRDWARSGFIWSDLNGDGIPQPDEVQVSDGVILRDANLVGDDLSLLFRDHPAVRFRPTLRADGLPVYDIRQPEILDDVSGYAFSTEDGRIFEMGTRMWAADGKTALWSYPDNYPTVQASAGAPGGFANRPPGVLVGELKIMGHFTIGAEELYVTNGNHGDWYAFTRDGLLAAAIFGGPSGYGRRWWSMPECVPGNTDLTDLRLTVEDFYGSIAKCEDGHVYAVAGKNHNSIVRVDGLEQMQRLNGQCAVTAADVRKAQAWEVQAAARERARLAPKIALLPQAPTPPIIDGSLDDWPDAIMVPIEEVRNEQNQIVRESHAAVAFDQDKLYIAGAGQGYATQMLNTAADLTRVFQGGDALDIFLGFDPQGDPQRTRPIAGDLRLVLTRVHGEPVVVCYRAVVPGTPPDKATVFTSPVGKEVIDSVTVLKNIEMRVVTDELGFKWALEAAIPWKALGVPPPQEGQHLRADFGLLIGDAQGQATVVRRYWANHSQVVLGDLPSEARLTPVLWGELRCVIPDEKMHFGGPETPGADNL